MRSLARVLALLLASILLPETVRGQTAELIDAMLAPVDEVAAGANLQRFLSEPLSGGLEAGTSTRISVSLPSGVPVRIIGVCDADCSDLDLTLVDGSGNQVATDVELDATPVLNAEATSSQGYELSVAMIDCSVEPCYWTVMVYVDESAATAASSALSNAGGSRREAGSLATGDNTLDGGEFVDGFTVDGRAGESLVVDLTANGFDPYLIVIAPDGTQTDNDDFEGDVTRSLVALDLTADGEYRVLVTSYAGGETGSYDLSIDAGAATGASTVVGRSEQGTLGSGDTMLESGEFLDEYTFEGRPGQRVSVALQSSDFDTYLMLIGPDDFREENDDADGSTDRSVIDADLTERGTYRVIVTSYAPGESGTYALEIGAAETTAASAGQRDVERLAPGQPASGRLEEGDAQIETGEFSDLWAFEGTAGQHVVVEMTSNGFDSWLGLVGPDGTVIDQNDDADGRTDLSRVEVTLRDSGRFRVVATSFGAGETGNYTLALRTENTTAATPAPAASGSGGQMYGIFAGISDYGGRASNLAYTAEDAVNFAAALEQGSGLRPENSFVLTDSEATTGNIRSAFQQIGQVMGPDDTFVFFYSGHGSRVPRAAGPDRADPDGLDETLSLYDADITDDEMHELMTLVDGGISVLILDACFSGGFSKDVISMPGRIGFFSSEEDVTSQVAAKFRAGGYLSIFAADAVGGGYADVDGDGSINAIELSQYLHERYQADVKSADPSDYVRTGGPQSGFQHLVVDRGSIGPYDIVFR
jgi:hypothetical protein